MFDKFYCDKEIRCRNTEEEEVLDKIKYFSLYSVSPPSIKEVADEMYYLNQNIEEVAEIIIKQNLMILRRLEELSDRLDKLENSSDKMNESSLSENIEDKMERIEMKINYLLDNKWFNKKNKKIVDKTIEHKYYVK